MREERSRDADERTVVPNVMTDYKAVHGFVHADPFDSPFWDPIHATSDKMDVNAWNYYGSMSAYLATSVPNPNPTSAISAPPSSTQSPRVTKI